MHLLSFVASAGDGEVMGWGHEDGREEQIDITSLGRFLFVGDAKAIVSVDVDNTVEIVNGDILLLLLSTQRNSPAACTQSVHAVQQFLYFQIVQLNLEEWEHGNKKPQQVEIWNKISEFKQAELNFQSLSKVVLHKSKYFKSSIL